MSSKGTEQYQHDGGLRDLLLTPLKVTISCTNIIQQRIPYQYTRLRDLCNDAPGGGCILASRGGSVTEQTWRFGCLSQKRKEKRKSQTHEAGDGEKKKKRVLSLV